MGGALFVHAHPDDETITTGATMALCAASGVDVSLVTCTRGEEGEVIPPGLAYLEDERDKGLGPFRAGELRRALTELGVGNHWYLDDLAPAVGGGRVHYRDSGMAGTPPGSHPSAFAAQPVDSAAAPLAALLDRLQPAVAVTYDPEGGYGHPDHVQAHRVLMRAVELSSWPVPKVYWIARPRSLAGPTSGSTNPVDDALVTTAVDGSAYLDRKIAAMRAHATQIEVSVDGPHPTFALSDGVWQPISAVEYFRLVRGTPSPPYDADGRETALLPA